MNKNYYTLPSALQERESKFQYGSNMASSEKEFKELVSNLKPVLVGYNQVNVMTSKSVSFKKMNSSVSLRIDEKKRVRCEVSSFNKRTCTAKSTLYEGSCETVLLKLKEHFQ